ncbi:MAG: hypothetical protein ACRCXL_05740 [Dermatophilaceae bacterium]
MRAHLARHDIGAVFGFLKERGFTWSAMAAATGLGAGRVSEIAARRRLVTDYVVLERIAEGLDIPRHFMGLGLDERAHGHRAGGPRSASTRFDGGAEVDHRDLLGAVAGIAVGAIPADLRQWLPDPATIVLPAVVTVEDVATVRAVTAVHRSLDAVAGGGTCLQSARGYATWATQLLSAARIPDALDTDLRAALADLHNLVGWAAHDLDQHQTARRHLVQSLVLARQTDTLPLLANILYRLGRVSLHQDQPGEALHLFGLGQLAAQQARCPAGAAILHANTAWAYARLGADTRVADSLARARADLDHADPDTAPAWTRFALSDADVHGISAVVHTALARHPQFRSYADLAAESSHQAVLLRRPEEHRSLAFDTISVAAASTITGDLGTAAEYAAQAVAMVENGIRSARVVGRLAALWRLAAPHAEQRSELAEVGFRIVRLQAA